MTRFRRQQSSLAWIIGLFASLATIAIAPPARTEACGGFFCQQVPIDQAAEQIIFRQDGDQVTAVVLIQYVGDAADFSWVVPVPGVPELSVGSELVFSSLEPATRPQFNLTINGEPCPSLDFPIGFNVAAPTADAGSAEDGVEILSRLAVGPFDVVVVTSEDSEAMATWLTDNNYDLTDRGRELIEPYVNEGMNFVAVRLRQDQGTGDIQPLIMRYTSQDPMVPIRLTAVAAQQDMGVLVWLLGSARAVPLNYLHVTPNYTRLNWYSGQNPAYASYQTLVTAAMDEAGGRGFATDFAGRDLSFLDQLPVAASLRDELTRLAEVPDDAIFITGIFNGTVFPQDKVLEILRRNLPLPSGFSESVYGSAGQLDGIFSAETLAAARAAIATELEETQIAPLEETLTVFDGDLYMTRLYTTISPEEMTEDPFFSFNPDLEGQQLDRNATLDISCSLGVTQWSLTLGAGTGRDGEIVIEATGEPPTFFGTLPTVNQDAAFSIEQVARTGAPTLISQLSTGSDPVLIDSLLSSCGSMGCGAGLGIGLVGTLFGLGLVRARRRH
jgi:hypothetical protein